MFVGLRGLNKRYSSLKITENPQNLFATYFSLSPYSVNLRIAEGILPFAQLQMLAHLPAGTTLLCNTRQAQERLTTGKPNRVTATRLRKFETRFLVRNKFSGKSSYPPAGLDDCPF